MMKKTLFLPMILCLFALTNTQAKNGMYLGLEGGIATQSNLPSPEQIGAIRTSTSYNPNAIRASVGYNHDLYSFLGLGLEVGLGWYARTTYTYPDGATSEVSSRTLEFLPVITFHVNEKVDLLTKIGGLRLTPLIAGRNSTTHSAEITTEAGIGAVYNFTPHWAGTVTVSRIFNNHENVAGTLAKQVSPTINMAMLGIRYSF